MSLPGTRVNKAPSLAVMLRAKERKQGPDAGLRVGCPGESAIDSDESRWRLKFFSGDRQLRREGVTAPHWHAEVCLHPCIPVKGLEPRDRTFSSQ